MLDLRLASGPRRAAIVVVILALILLIAGVAFRQFLDGRDIETPSIEVQSIMDYHDGVEVTFKEPASPVTWGDVVIQMGEGSNMTNWDGFSTLDLTNFTAPTVWHCEGGRALGSLSLWLNITDSQGNGLINDSDRISFDASGGCQGLLTYDLELFHRHSGKTITNCSFEWAIGETPSVSVLSRMSVDFGYEIVLTDPTYPVEWGEVSVFLTDGTLDVVWYNFTTNDLLGLTSAKTWRYGVGSTIGDLTIFLNITDMAGDGKIDSGDHLTFTTKSSPTFSTKVYWINLYFKPTGEPLLLEYVIND